MIWWTGLAPWEFEFPFPGSLTFAFLARVLTGVTDLEDESHNLRRGCRDVLLGE